MEPKQLSLELRKGQNPDLSRRRFILSIPEANRAFGILLGKQKPDNEVA